MSVHFRFLVKHLSACIFKLEGQNREGLVYCPKLLHVYLVLNRASFNWLTWLNDLAHNLNDGLTRDLARITNHSLADSLADKEDSLDSGVRFAHYDKRHFALGSDVVGSASNSDLLAVVVVADVLYSHVNSLLALFL